MGFPRIAFLPLSTTPARSFSIISSPSTQIFKNTPRAINIQIDRSIIDKITSCIPRTYPNAHNKIPDSQEIKEGQQGLVKIFHQDKGVQEYFREFSKIFRVVAVGIDYKVPKESDNPFARCLIATTLFYGVGLIPVRNKTNNPLFGEIVSGVGKVDGHQDAIFNSDGALALVKHLAILNLGGSSSNCNTWYKSNDFILEELKENFPSSYDILTTINFSSKESNNTQLIIGKNDNLNFLNHNLYLPVQSDLDEYGISKEKASEAIINLKKTINSKENRQKFLLRDDGNEISQVACIKNEDGFHGREPGSGVRNVTALALEKDRKSITGPSILGRG